MATLLPGDTEARNLFNNIQYHIPNISVCPRPLFRTHLPRLTPIMQIKGTPGPNATVLPDYPASDPDCYWPKYKVCLAFRPA
jgi:hypothetical protein